MGNKIKRKHKMATAYKFRLVLTSLLALISLTYCQQSNMRCIVIFQDSSVRAMHNGCIAYFWNNPCQFKRLGLRKAFIQGSALILELLNDDCPESYACMKKHTGLFGLFGSSSYSSEII